MCSASDLTLDIKHSKSFYDLRICWVVKSKSILLLIVSLMELSVCQCEPLWLFLIGYWLFGVTFFYCWLAAHLLPRQSLDLSHMVDFVLVLVWACLWQRLNTASLQKSLFSCAHYITTPSHHALSLPLQDNSLNVTSQSFIWHSQWK